MLLARRRERADGKAQFPSLEHLLGIASLSLAFTERGGEEIEGG